MQALRVSAINYQRVKPSLLTVLCPGLTCRLSQGQGVFTLGDTWSFSGLTSKIPPQGSMLNFDADVNKNRPRVTNVKKPSESFQIGSLAHTGPRPFSRRSWVLGLVRSPFRAKHHVVVQYMAAGLKCPLPPPPSPTPSPSPSPLPDLPPYQTPPPARHPPVDSMTTGRQGGQG